MPKQSSLQKSLMVFEKVCKKFPDTFQLIEFPQQTIPKLYEEMALLGDSRIVLPEAILKKLDTHEVPRSGICLISKNCLEKSCGLGVIQQTLFIKEFAETIFPKIKKNPTWETSFKELCAVISMLSNLPPKSFPHFNMELKKSYASFAKLEINTIFRPSITEVVHQIYLNKNSRKFLYANTGTITKTRPIDNEAGYSFLSISSAGKFGATVREINFQKRKLKFPLDHIGTTFICSVEELQKLLN